jgi:hypothetical protein
MRHQRRDVFFAATMVIVEVTTQNSGLQTMGAWRELTHNSGFQTSGAGRS